MESHRRSTHGAPHQRRRRTLAAAITRSRALRLTTLVLALLLALATRASAAEPPSDDTSLTIHRPGASAAADAGGARTIFLLARQRDDLGDLVLDVATPGSPLYGHHVPVADLAAEYGASADTISRLTSYLARFGVTPHVDPTGTFASAFSTPQQIEALFGPAPHPTPPIPDELRGIVTLILGAFPGPQAAAFLPRGPRPGRAAQDPANAWPPWNKISGTPAPCPAGPLGCTNDHLNPGPPSAFQMYTPDQLRTAYGITASGLTGKGRTAVLFELGETVEPSDVATYADGFGLPMPTLAQVVIDGPAAATPPGGEATLDLETLLGLAPGLERVTLVTAPVTTQVEALIYTLMLFSAALDSSLTGGVLTDVISVSYGIDCEPTIAGGGAQGAAYVAALDAILQTAGAAGVTVAAGAGDQGSSACASRTPPFQPSELALLYPGSSAWLTSVGGTNVVLEPDNEIQSIGVWNDWPLQLDQAIPHLACDAPPCRPAPIWAGGGGQSILYDRPKWQVGRGVDLSAGRQVPDLAFLADIYPGTAIYYDGQWTSGNGTSQATPIFAAITLLLNEHNASKRRPPIGFANPLLYTLARRPSVFVDVVVGENVVGDQEERFAVDCCFAKPGFDMASGWGSLLVDRAVAALGAPPPRLKVLEPGVMP